MSTTPTPPQPPPLANEQELQAALRQRLHATGALESLKAQLRVEVLKHLVVHPPPQTTTPPPEPTPKNFLLINLLIQQYLSMQGYDHTLSIFRQEACMKGADGGEMDVAVIKEDLGLVSGEDEEESLLVGIVHALKALKKTGGKQ